MCIDIISSYDESVREWITTQTRVLIVVSLGIYGDHGSRFRFDFC